ncbi:uncharacterized protein G2W53_003156 [Senna tora]|uniref:Thioredoxin-like protein 4B n=1 Tax=Senna tora TaxID=362788 RepID=A0A834XAT3_9FABA|nr:uncharacterized protein G2W53_003156 [Senna tora]
MRTIDKVLILRFGRSSDSVCLQLDNILSKSTRDVSKFATVALVDIDSEDIQVYVKYFDITLIPSTIFFFNAHHMKMDSGTADHTKWIGAFHKKQDFIDVVEAIFRGAMKGKLIVNCPLPPERIPKYQLLYKDRAEHSATMEVEVPAPAPENFNFDSNCSSPYMTAPSSPQRFGNFFFSAPTSPTRPSSPSFFLPPQNDDELPRHSSASSSVPFLWEHKPGVPKSTDDPIDGQDFEFNFTAERLPSSADELFDGGKIRPLKLPPRLQSGDGGGGLCSPTSHSNRSSPRSRISQGKRIVQEAFSSSSSSPKNRDFDPFEAAMEETRKSNEGSQQNENNRGRERSSGRKASRSCSPMRVSDIIMSDSVSEEFSQTPSVLSSSSRNTKPSLLSSISFGYRKWKLKDFLLFRSASEGRATEKDPLRKYTMLSKKAAEEDAKNSSWSFRSTESSSSGSASRRRTAVSAHELHYTVNRAASEEMKKKTFLPYKQGLLGCLGFNPGIQEISRGIGSLSR